MSDGKDRGHVSPLQKAAELGWYVQRRYEAKAFCTNPGCERVKLDGKAENGIRLDLAHFELTMRADELEARLKCSVCGQHGIKLYLKRPPPTPKRSPLFEIDPPRPPTGPETRWYRRRDDEE